MVALHVLLALLVGLLLALLGCLFLAYTLYVHYVHIKYSHIPGPKRTSFFGGNLSQLTKAVQDKRLVDDVFLDWSNEHGKVFVYFVLHHAITHVYIPEVIRDILILDNYPKEPKSYQSLQSQFGQRFMGRSLVTEIDHETWKPMNAMFSPTFHRNFLKTCIIQFNASCDLLCDELSKKADGKTEVNMLEMFNKVSLDGISKVAFGLDLNVFDEPQLLGDIKFLGESTVLSYLRPLLWCNPLQSAVAYRQKARRAAKNVRKIARDCITARIEALNRGENLNNNILSHILQTTGNNGIVTDTELEKMVDHFVTFLGAGQDTTACLMASTLLELGRHPEDVYKMKTEADAVIGDNGFVSFENLSKLKYTTAVLKESLRVHPPVSAILRQLPKDVIWNDIKIPSGSTVCVAIMNLGRLPEYIASPEEFMPSRFLGDESFNYVHFPFSLGPRKCIGQQFAMIEARVIMAKLMKHFTFDLVPGQSFHYVKQVTCKPIDGCLVYIKPAAHNPDGSARMPFCQAHDDLLMII